MSAKRVALAVLCIVSAWCAMAVMGAEMMLEISTAPFVVRFAEATELAFAITAMGLLGAVVVMGFSALAEDTP